MLTREDADALIALPKFGDPPSEWVDRQNNGNQREMIFGVTDNAGKAMQGIQVQVRLNSERRINSKRWAFGIMQSGTFFATQRIYMLEVLDPQFIGHQDEQVGRLYGPHERIGPDTVQLDPAMFDWSFSDCVNWFTNRIKLTLIQPIVDPTVLELR